MKSKKTVKKVFEEILANGIGWVAGILSIDILKLFFIEKRWFNLWGIFSKRTAVSSTTFSFLEWTLTAIIGFVVMLLVNGFIRKKLFKKRLVESSEEMEETTDNMPSDEPRIPDESENIPTGELDEENLV